MTRVNTGKTHQTERSGHFPWGKRAGSLSSCCLSFTRADRQCEKENSQKECEEKRLYTLTNSPGTVGMEPLYYQCAAYDMEDRNCGEGLSYPLASGADF